MNRPAALSAVALLLVLACRRGETPPVAHEEDSSWAVTAWGERYEVFAETDGLVAGQAVTSNAHVTTLSDFSPLPAGAVVAILRGGTGAEQRFRQTQPKRDGIFPVEIRPAGPGTFELLFAVEGPSGPEEIAAGRVQVGPPTKPGGLLASKEEEPGAISFLKEQQWRTEFATAWAAEGAIREALAGPGRVLPARGGEVVLTAAVDAVLASQPWPYKGLDVAGGATIFSLRPRAGDRSLPDLGAEATSLAAEAETARSRVERLTELVRLEATSPAELERARAALAGIEARLAATRAGVAAAGGGGAEGRGLAVRAPWAGRVADVSVTPGQAVAAGTVLGRLVKPRPLWVEVALRPEDVVRLKGAPSGLNLRQRPGDAPMEIEARSVRLISIAPEVDRRTATIAATLEVDRSAAELPIGTALEAEVVLGGERLGIVVPESALVDDSGVTVAYVQSSGESFARREVQVVARQGARALITGLSAGERVVTKGGAAVRRSSLLSSGAPEGHVH
jgi:cobalt-zinc-cadmium efflux system membrane fusion protein